MCSVGPHFKLCTCSNDETVQNFWILNTGNTHIINDVVGKIVRPPDIGEIMKLDFESFIIGRLLHDLNNTNIFDFNYTPKAGDKICFFFEELKNNDFDEQQDYSIEVVFDGEQFDTVGLGSDYEGGKELMRGEICVVPFPDTT